MGYIRLEDICLNYKVKKDTKIKDLFLGNKAEQQFSQMSQNGVIPALKNITLNIEDGDRVAIIGQNGAGKSSFLKLVSGIYPPSAGVLKTEGSIATMFEMATGFDMEASGWDNIMLRGIMMGENPKVIDEKMQSIAEFSELGEYLDIPVKYYSTGMFVRLAFSVSTSINPDILLLDEVLSAGDAAFVGKAQRRVQEMMNSAKILVLVTHSMDSAINFCNKAIWLSHGEIKMMGEPKKIVEEYMMFSDNYGSGVE